MPIDAILERLSLENVFEMVDRRLVAFALDGHGPRLGLQRVRELRRLILARAEFVVVVVRGDLIPRVRLFCSAQRAALDVIQLPAVRRGLLALRQRAHIETPGGRGPGCDGRRPDECPAVHIDGFVGDLRAADVWGTLDQHGASSIIISTYAYGGSLDGPGCRLSGRRATCYAAASQRQGRTIPCRRRTAGLLPAASEGSTQSVNCWYASARMSTRGSTWRSRWPRVGTRRFCRDPIRARARTRPAR